VRDLLILVIHLLVIFARLLGPGGVRALAAESLLLKHQLLISNRSRQRAPNLTTLDRFVLGLFSIREPVPYFQSFGGPPSGHVIQIP
jgi:putative transposase